MAKPKPPGLAAAIELHGNHEQADVMSARNRLHLKTTGPGKPAKIFDERITNEILRRVASGERRGDMLLAMGISASTLTAWKTYAQNGSVFHQKFFEDLDRADAEGRVIMREHIVKAAVGALDKDGIHKSSWQAAAWLLEREHPSIYGKVETVKTEVTQAPVAKIDPRKLSTEEIMVMRDLLVKSATTPPTEEIIIDAESSPHVPE